MIDPVNDLIYDVGLHRGEDTAFYLAKGYRVVAFEADPALVDACRRRFETALRDGRLEIVEGAIATRQGRSMMFYRDPDQSMWGTTDPAWVQRNASVARCQALSVPTVDFSEHLRRTGVPHFMKIDVEGADRGCIEALLDQPSTPGFLSLESDKTNFEALVDEFDLLARLGYDRFAVVQQGGMERRQIDTTRLDGRWLSHRFERHSSGGFGTDVGPWISREEALARYRRIFRAYRLLGDESVLRRTRLGRAVRGQSARLLHRPLPGWYDTHATKGGI